MRSLMSRDLRWPGRPRVSRLVIIVITMWIAYAIAPALAVAAAGEAPVIESTGSSVGGEVSVSASINPEGLVTSYELKLVCGICGPAGYAPATGQLSAVREAISVSLELPGIKPGTYSFEVHARNSAGEAVGHGEVAVPEQPAGGCPDGCGSNEQYDSETPGWYAEFSESESAETREKYEAEERAKEQKEQEERNARYATELAELKKVEQEEEREAAVRERQEEEAAHPACRVPVLEGDTVAVARNALVKAHCRLGAVHWLARDRGVRCVLRQGAAPGTRLRHGARVALWVGARRRGARRVARRDRVVRTVLPCVGASRNSWWRR
jgi:hypothetical protein